MGKFKITRRTNDEYQFVLKAGNGETILVSEGYKAMSGCLNGIESVKTNSPIDARYDRKVSTNNKYYFNLKAANGEIIGTSEMYEAVAGRENGIASVKANAPTATTEDLT